MEPIRTGSETPRIVLPDQGKNVIDVLSMTGTKLLSFHPLAWTSTCRRQMEGLELHADAFAEANTLAFGISVDPVPSKKAWAETIGINKTRLLSDFWPHGAVASSLGLFRERDGFSERASVIVDVTGRVRFVKVYPITDLPDIDELLEAIRAL